MNRLPAKTNEAWAVVWRSNNALDGATEHYIGTYMHPCRVELFDTRKSARSFVKDRYGYIATRPDLQTEPHGWETPRVVKVRVTVDQIS